jgi:hypothetical protein
LATQLQLPLSSRPSGAPAPSGIRCRRLRLEEPLGAGALGTTWRSRLPDGPAVALKLVRTGGRVALARLERMQHVGRLGGSALLEVLAAFEEDGRVWVVSRLDEGVPLSRLLERGGLPPAHAVAVGLGVLGALTALHDRGLWHGAVHARNVHVGRDGSVRVGDYGLVEEPAGETSAALRAADVQTAATLIGLALGGARRLSGSLGPALRAIAGSRRLLPAGYEAAHAGLTLREGAGQMAAPGRLRLARAQLATTVEGVLSEVG